MPPHLDEAEPSSEATVERLSFGHLRKRLLPDESKRSRIERVNGIRGCPFCHSASPESHSIFTKRLYARRVFYLRRCVQAVETSAAQKNAARQIEWLVSR
jgi:hypothetical protein